ncbi:hypothetical protein MVEN_01572300 [Mycena venus]|uniref:Thioredoxin domain-containing protein n=1 Tax=Mycena venus TaxID=2733690 RepID=A0A8H7CRI8_9AGAR|nr:hypothetical protein MVEN_01572300 [Mycena venus]
MHVMAQTGEVFVSGIQDISAFLPIIGSDQCESHVGDALEGGYLYAAATPLSMFGSLGIIKGSVAVLCASASPRLAQMYADAGFNLVGSAAAMIAKIPTGKAEKVEMHDGKLEIPYVARGRMLDLLKKQHIEKLSNLSLEFNYTRWNVFLVLTTASFSILGFSPYIPLTLNDGQSFKKPPAWVYPLLRIAGSAICVITVQFLIQARIKKILEDTLKEIRRGNSGDPGASSHDAEQGTPNSSSPLLGSSNLSPPKPRLSIRITLLQFILLLGIAATGVGYVGCFTVVQSSSVRNTYIWLGLEISLSIVRMVLWGLNPPSDENTGVTVKISSLAGQAPFITTARNYSDLMPHDNAFHKHSFRGRQSFMVVENLQFLNHLAPFTGPLEPFSDPDHHVAIYYALVGDYNTKTKVLLTAVSDLDSKGAFVLEHRLCLSPAAHARPDVYAVALDPLLGTGIMIATLEPGHAEKLDNMHQSIRTGRFNAIHRHSQDLIHRIAGRNRVTQLPLSWSLNRKHALDHSSQTGKTIELEKLSLALTDAEKNFMCLELDFNNTIVVCNRRAMDRATTLLGLLRDTKKTIADNDAAVKELYVHFQLTYYLMESLERCRAAALELWAYLNSRELANRVLDDVDDVDSDIFTCAWMAELGARRKFDENEAESRMERFQKAEETLFEETTRSHLFSSDEKIQMVERIRFESESFADAISVDYYLAADNDIDELVKHLRRIGKSSTDTVKKMEGGPFSSVWEHPWVEQLVESLMDAMTTRVWGGPEAQLYASLKSSFGVEVAGPPDLRRTSDGLCLQFFPETQELKCVDNLNEVMNRGDGVTVIYFWADWCPPCQAIAPWYQKLSRLNDFKDLVFYTIHAGGSEDYSLDVMANRGAAIEGFPSFAVFREGKEVGRCIGNDIGALQTLLKKAVNPPAPTEVASLETKTDLQQEN